MAASATRRESVHDLMDQLRRDPDWEVRRGAALRLASHREPQVVEALVASLSDRDPDVRHAAVLALGQLGDPSAVDELCRPKLLEDPSPNLRWATVTALGQLGSLKVASVLSRALDAPEWVVRNQALLAISDYIRRLPAIVDGEQIKSLIRLLAIPDREVRTLVVDALARRSTRGMDEMVEAMKVKSEMVRAGVAEAMGLSQDPRAIPTLIEATRDPVSTVRREAARGLGRLGEAEAVEALIVVLGDTDQVTARAAADALVAIGTPAVEPLCSALGHAIAKLHRRNVLIALGGIRAPQAVMPLLNNLSSTYYVVRQAAINALSAYGESVVDELIPMVQVGEVPLDALVHEALHQTNRRLKLRAVRALGELKHAAAIKPLRTLMDSSDRVLLETTQDALSKIGLAAWARHGAVIALGNIGHCKAVPALLKALKDHAEYVRLEAARGLAKIPDPAAIVPLIEALSSDEDGAVRREVAMALRVVGGQSPVVAHAFRQALGDPSWEVRAEAARALGRVDDEASVEPLLAALEDSSYTVQTSAEHALANLGDLALPGLLRIGGGPTSPRLGPAVRALAEMLGEPLKAEVQSLADAPQDHRRKVLEELARR